MGSARPCSRGHQPRSAQLRVDLGGQEATVPVDREFALGVAVGNIVSLAISRAHVLSTPTSFLYSQTPRRISTMPDSLPRPTTELFPEALNLSPKQREVLTAVQRHPEGAKAGTVAEEQACTSTPPADTSMSWSTLGPST